MCDVVAIGELLIDFTCVGTDEYGYPLMQAHPGGAPANFLASLAKFGAKTALIAKVGNDALGHKLVKTMSEIGVDTSGIVIADDAFTTLAFVTLDERGEREFSFARKPGADTSLRFEEIDLSLIDSAKILHFGTLSLTDEPSRTATYKAVEYAESRGKMISFDPNLREALWSDLESAKEQILWGLSKADIVKLSREEAEFLFGENPEKSAAKIVNDYGVKLVFITCGADGCVYRSKNVSGTAGLLGKVKAVDTTGAGDIFGGAAVGQILRIKKSPEELSAQELAHIAGFACKVAAVSVTRPGGIYSVPEPDEIG